jgi:hypothetical protein
MVLVKNEELALFSGKEMVWDAGYVLNVCKDDEKMVSYTKRGGGCPVDEHGARMEAKRRNASQAGLVPVRPGE